MRERNEHWIAGFNRGQRIIASVSSDHSAENLKQVLPALYEGIGIEYLSEADALKLSGSVSALVTEILRLNLELRNDDSERKVDAKQKLH